MTEPAAAPPPANTAFISGTFQQFAWDSTSLGELKTCPQKYFLSVVQGWVPRLRSVHLTFGLVYHSAGEHYEHAKARGLAHDAAVLVAVRHTLEATWNAALGRPVEMDDQYKNRETLVRTVVWHLDQFREDALETVILGDGRPAIELSFRFETTYQAPNGQPYILCGHLDRLATMQGHTYVVDKKTTKHTLEGVSGSAFYATFSPDNQMSLYSFASKIVYQTPVSGVIIDAAQIAVSFSRFQRGFVSRTESQLAEWYDDLGWWLAVAKSYAEAGKWPMNDKACGNYGGCPFRSICSKPPEARETWLKATFARRVWDPLQVRGDI